MKIEQRMDVDLVWVDKSPGIEPTNILVYHQEEHGSATALAGKALLGKETPVARVYSKLMSVPAINYMPSPMWPEYRIYETRSMDGQRWFIIRIPRCHPLEITMSERMNVNNWLYTYPIVRDIILILNQYGARTLTYMTADLFSIHPEFKEYGSIKHGHLGVFNFNNINEEVLEYFGDKRSEHGSDFALAPNVWIWCNTFANFNPSGYAKVLLTASSPKFVDMDAADALLNYIQNQYHLPYDENILNQFASQLETAADMTYIKMDLEDEQDDDYDMTGWEV